MAKKQMSISYEKLNDLKSTFDGLGGDKQKLAETLIDEAIFCGETLKKLKEEITNEGVVTEMCQGAYSIKRSNPALQCYNNTIKNYQALIKQIKELLPNEQVLVDDGFDDFIG